ncbi:MAG: low molecular weight protein tyrosine phosphatase family protein [Rubrivivax sp.]
MHHVLFVCSQNRLRSPTAEAVFSSHPGIECQSAGVHDSAETPVDPEILAWADLIFVMEKAHRSKLTRKFGRHLGGKRVVVLDIPDDYQFMDPRLVPVLQRKVGPFLARLAGRPAAARVREP